MMKIHAQALNYLSYQAMFYLHPIRKLRNAYKSLCCSGENRKEVLSIDKAP